MFQIDSIYPPYAIDRDQDNWVGTISRDGYLHQIEIRAVDEQELRDLLNEIVTHLNGLLTRPDPRGDHDLIYSDLAPVTQPEPDDDYDRAMRGI